MIPRTTMAQADAVIKPLTLIEKLNDHKETITVLRGTEKQGGHEFTFLGHHLLGFQTAIDIVKQHSDWVNVDERLPDKFWDDDKKYYCRVDTMGCIDFKILVWRYGDWHNLDLSPLGQKGFTIMPKVTHYFELPQPPSEVQDDQNCKTMPCSHDGYSDCK